MGLLACLRDLLRQATWRGRRFLSRLDAEVLEPRTCLRGVDCCIDVRIQLGGYAVFRQARRQSAAHSQNAQHKIQDRLGHPEELRRLGTFRARNAPAGRGWQAHVVRVCLAAGSMWRASARSRIAGLARNDIPSANKARSRRGAATKRATTGSEPPRRTAILNSRCAHGSANFTTAISSVTALRRATASGSTSTPARNGSSCIAHRSW